MFNVENIDRSIAFKFIKDNNFELMMNQNTDHPYKFWKDKYIYYGVFDNDVLVAVQIVDEDFGGWSYEKNRIEHSCHLVAMQKIPGTKHGAFNAVLDYFEKLYKDKYIYLEVYVDKLRDMYEGLGFERIFKNNEHFYRKKIYA